MKLNIPKHLHGHSVFCEEHISFKTNSAALAHYRVMRDRLLDINNWHNLIGFGSARFEITDQKGNKVHRKLIEGDHIRIDIPGPGLPSSKGYDWVRAFSIKEISTIQEVQFELHLKPCSDHTQGQNKDIAHFFTQEATSSIFITHKDNANSIYYAGTNEVANTENKSNIDNVRNFIIGHASYLGLNQPQWNQLIKAIIKFQ